MSAARAPRIVLYPYGQPSAAEPRARCAEFVWGLGGDMQRMIDGPFSNLDRFSRYVRHFEDEINRPDAPAIVVLTRTNPLGLAVMNVRRKLEQTLPALRRATWVLIVDPAEDPFFVESARKLGTLAQRADSPASRRRRGIRARQCKSRVSPARDPA